MKLALCRILTIILRLIQLLFGVISISLLVTNSDFTFHGLPYTVLTDSRILSFITCTSTYFTASFLLLIATIHRDSFEHMRKSIFEMLYNIFGALVQGINSIVLMAVTESVASDHAGAFYVVGVLGLINAAFYFVTFFIAMKARQAT